jgi:hypothetical protein
MMKKILPIVMLSMIIYSCTGDFFTEASRPDAVPVTTKPNVESFGMENRIVITWAADDAADEYILYRDTNPAGSFNTAVYKGNGLSYVDANVTTDAFYYYKLSKKQGKKEFSKSDYSIGVCKDIKKDACEDNDTADSATPLTEINTDANIYYYKDYRSGMAVEDKDWYKVTLPPMHRLILGFHNVVQGGFPQDGELFFNIKYGMPQAIIDYTTKSDTYLVENTGYETQTIYFEVSINKTKLTPDVNGSYTKFGSYTIVCQKTEVINF